MITDNDRLNILVSEYGLVKSELQTYIELFHKHTDYLTLYVSAAAAIAAFAPGLLASTDPVRQLLLTRCPLVWPLSGDAAIYQIVAFVGYILITTMGMYFVAATLSYMYLIEVLARRAAAIEARINRLSGDNLMLWEILSPRLIRGFVRVGLWVSPSAVRVVWACAILAVIVSAQFFTTTAVMGRDLAKAFFLYGTVVVLFQTSQIFGQRIWGIPNIDHVMMLEQALADKNKYGAATSPDDIHG
jgi:hypothetical protein